jgi:hypothetical protein
MDMTFKKHFDDRYTQSREHQILDYLNQRGAAVPQVILNHAELGYLEMSHAGQSLAQWLVASDQVDLPIFDALSQSVSRVLEVSRLGIWHLDIAPRNFMVRLNADTQSLQVCLIDFGNAVSTLFPLQKPLWMRPSAEQHRLLRQALQQDWQSFYHRHGLVEPTHWEQTFDVPQDRYQADWTRGLKTEALASRTCVLAHGLGQMLVSTGRILQGTTFLKGDLGASLLNLEDDQQASSAIESALLQLQARAQASRTTPRPTRKLDPNASGTSLAPLVPQVALYKGTAIGSAIAGNTSIATTADIPFAGSRSVNDPVASNVTQTLRVPEDESTQAEVVGQSVAQANAASIPLPPRRWPLWLPIFTCAALMTLGWLLIDLIYQAASASKPLKLTLLAFGGVAFAVFGTLIGLLGLWWSSRKQTWWRRLFYVNVTGQAMLVLELWVFEMSYPVIALASVCPMIVLVLCVSKLVNHDGVSSR